MFIKSSTKRNVNTVDDDETSIAKYICGSVTGNKQVVIKGLLRETQDEYSAAGLVFVQQLATAQ